MHKFSVTSHNASQQPIITIILSIFLGFILGPSSAFGHDFSLGLAAVESGHDRFRPGASASVRIGATAFAEVAIWGRTFGHIKEETLLGTLGGKWPLGISHLYFAGGISFLREKTKITFPEPNNTAVQETSLSHGLSLGTGYTLFRYKKFHGDISWVSNIYPAGGNAILLAHGRIQLITFSSGIEL